MTARDPLVLVAGKIERLQSGDTLTTGGGGGLSGLTSTKIPKATSSTAIGDGSITDDGTSILFANPFSIGIAPIGLCSATMYSTSTTQTTLSWFQSAGSGHVGSGGINEAIPIVVRNTATFDTTSLSGYSAGIDLVVSSTRAAGANPLNNKGMLISCSGGDTNLAIDVTAGTCNFQDVNCAGNTEITGTATFKTNGTTTICDSSHDATVGRKLTVNGGGSLTDAVVAKGNVVAGSVAGPVYGRLRALTQNGGDGCVIGIAGGSKDWSFYPSGSDLLLFEYATNLEGGSGSDRVKFVSGGAMVVPSGPITANTYVQIGGTSGPKWNTNAGTPESAVIGSPGDLCSDTTNGELYLKKSGAGTNTGWKLVTHA